MKAVLLVSMITFGVIFGVILISTGLLENAVKLGLPEPPGPATEADLAMERIQESLDVQRDAVQREAEMLRNYRIQVEVEQTVLDEQEQRLQALVAELETAQADFGAEREESIVKLAKLYEAMKPAKAAPILETLDPDTVLEILTRMKSRQAAKVLAAMNPALASEISHRMSLKGVSL
ncbi:MAG TPA: hypothetical protein P5571_06115 [Candidatus Krumholzibacteria bacterium]|nr:hypothetical protein [Candidatus Krumholzibacteria bacterium]HRX50916.1 hypothetical protein [Candidatus Krumholzibacteria bacterium]